MKKKTFILTMEVETSSKLLTIKSFNKTKKQAVKEWNSALETFYPFIEIKKTSLHTKK